MRDIIVLGGYGHAGRLCVRELVETTHARIVVAGRNVQSAERAALALGERARSAYANAADARTLHEELECAGAVVACASEPPLAALDRAIEQRIPFLSLTPFRLGARSREALAERAWDAGVPVVLCAGAVPGLAGVVAEALVRRFEALEEIRIASTGPWRGTPGARRAHEALCADWKPEAARARLAPGGRGRTPSRFGFPASPGRRRVRPARALDLDGFAEAHRVERLTYLEARAGRVARGVERLLQRERDPRFALVGDAFTDGREIEPAARIVLQADDAPRAAAAVVGALVRALITDKLPAGVLTPREALNPSVLLDSLSRRGVRVTE